MGKLRHERSEYCARCGFRFYVSELTEQCGIKVCKYCRDEGPCGQTPAETYIRDTLAPPYSGGWLDDETSVSSVYNEV